MSWYGSLWFCLVWSSLCASCTWISVFLLRFGMFLAIISSDTFCSPFLYLFLLGFLLCADWNALYYPMGLLYCFIFIFSFGFLFLFYFHHSVFQITYSFFSLFILLFTFSSALNSTNKFCPPYSFDFLFTIIFIYINNSS